MARDKGGQGIKAPPVVKYRKNIGTYQRESTRKEVKKVYRDRADKRKGNYGFITGFKSHFTIYYCLRQ